MSCRVYFFVVRFGGCAVFAAVGFWVAELKVLTPRFRELLIPFVRTLPGRITQPVLARHHGRSLRTRAHGQFGACRILGCPKYTTKAQQPSWVLEAGGVRA